MKQILPWSIALLLSAPVAAQTAFNTIEYNDINNLRTATLVHGDMWLNPFSQAGSCEYPKGSGKHVSSLGSLWMSGYDAQNNIKTAAQLYRTRGNDYWPGPIDANVPVGQTYAYVQQWAKIWKVNRSTIDSFRSMASHTVGNTPAAILQWPAKQNPYAAGNNNAPLTVSTDLAPFVDVNNDGVYNPLQGDYPAIKGDQLLWWVINDQMMPHGNTGSSPIGVEIHCMAYAYHRAGFIDNTIFYEYSIHNKGLSAYDNFRIGINANMDLGDPQDDYVGFDSSRRIAFTYNRRQPDMVYGVTVPAASIVLTELPGDSYTNRHAAGSFVPYYFSSGVNGRPDSQLHYHRMLNAMNRQGIHVHDDRTAGVGSTGFGSGPITNYAFSGNPNSPAEWSMCQSGLPGIDYAFVVATDTMTFAPGAVKRLGFALTVRPDGGTCPTVNMPGIQETADSALYVYWNPSVTTGIGAPVLRKSLTIFPNPATDRLHIVPSGTDKGEVTLYNALGQAVPAPASYNGREIVVNTAQLPHGVYTVLYRDRQTSASNVFVKE